LLTVGRAMVAAALTRTESRGCHRRTDHPQPRPEWVTHLMVGLPESNEISTVTVVTGPLVGS
ncbi:MAG: hypothetical protein M3431_04870, partial [Actinomycetota bacterium]|nr:hypothetical protein [Actinomycetota bacterium]